MSVRILLSSSGILPALKETDLRERDLLVEPYWLELLDIVPYNVFWFEQYSNGGSTAERSTEALITHKKTVNKAGALTK